MTTVHPEGMIFWTKCHRCRDISLETANLKLNVEVEEQYMGHQTQYWYPLCATYLQDFIAIHPIVADVFPFG